MSTIFITVFFFDKEALLMKFHSTLPISHFPSEFVTISALIIIPYCIASRFLDSEPRQKSPKEYAINLVLLSSMGKNDIGCGQCE